MSSCKEEDNRAEELPLGWAAATLGNIAEYINGFAFKPRDWKTAGLPIIRIQNLTDPKREFNYSDREIDPRYYVSDGDILVSWSATLDAFVWHRGNALLNQHIFKVVPCDELDRRFVFYLLRNSIEELKQSEHLHGSTMRHINRGPFLAHEIGLPPQNEQIRIADRLDELFSRIEKGEEHLKRVQALVKRYRQSVLKAAVTGELTRAWREKNAGKGETGEQLLQRILTARRAAWEAAELEKMRVRGKLPKENDWKQKYKEPGPPDTSGLPELPKRWVWATIDHFASVVGGVTVDARRNAEDTREVPYLRVANVQRGFLDLTEVKNIQVSEDVIRKLVLRKGDILFNEGGDIDKLGRGWVWNGEIDECIHQNHVFRARLFLEEIPSKFVSFYANALGQEYFIGQGKQTTNLASISLTKLKAFPVPVPPIEEARLLVELAEALLSDCDKVLAETEMSESSGLRLKQSILRHAFFGKLVPQDPNDESACSLLNRTAEKRSKIDTTEPKRGRRKRKIMRQDEASP